MIFGDDLDVTELSGSAGRRIWFELPIVDVNDPETGEGAAGAGLTRAEAEQLRDHLTEILERW